MKILVAVKRVIDYNVKIRVKADQSNVETEKTYSEHMATFFAEVI